MDYYRMVTLLALGVFVFIICGFVFSRQEPKSPKIDIDTAGQPTIGDPLSSIHIVVFEEPKCPGCKLFNNRIYPNLKKEYIDTRKVLYTVIPVSFINNSMPAAVALLCAYQQSPSSGNLFFSYLDYIYHHQPPESLDWATEENLKEMAKEASPSINLDALKSCISSASLRQQIEKNTQYGSELMEGQLETPSIYVSGRKLETISWEAIKNAIEQEWR